MPQLQARLGDLNPQVVTDGHYQRWSTWRSFHACLQACPADATHLLVIQDDAEPCPGFDRLAPACIAAKPDVIVCFYVGGGRVGMPLLRAAAHDEHWALLDRQLWIPVVATAFPREIVTEIIVWAAHDDWVPKARGDDAVLGKFMRASGCQAWATVPNLVQHPDLVPSVTKRRPGSGRITDRIAVCYIGDEDPTQIVW